ncbi:MAG: biopolymer transporter ExbD [Isosphaeraceae bacterium]
MRGRSARGTRRRLGEVQGVMFPVTPMLDMAFQLLAFFILTFQAPTREARIDLYLPSVAMALPKMDETGAPAPADEQRGELIITARSDGSGKLLSLSLNERPLLGSAELFEVLHDRIRPRVKLLKVALLADDHLKYEEAARLLGACSAAGVDSIRLADPAALEGRRP